MCVPTSSLLLVVLVVVVVVAFIVDAFIPAFTVILLSFHIRFRLFGCLLRLQFNAMPKIDVIAIKLVAIFAPDGIAFSL